MSHARYPSLHDRVVFISGGGSGIGATMVEAFAAQGASVAFVDIDTEGAAKVVERAGAIGQKPLFIECDLTNLAALEAAMEETGQRLGPIGALINNAANDTRRDLAEVTEADWDWAMAVNLKHQFFAAQIAARSMRELGGGSIINFSSVAWMTASRALGLFRRQGGGCRHDQQPGARTRPRQHSRQLHRAGLGVDRAAAPPVVHRGRHRRSDRAPCLPRALEPDAIASAALFLAADDSRMITKHCLVVDAGLR